MSDIIRLLPDSVANQIAAGEVIQRPASVVKELVENAIDADATHVDVLITDAGKTCIQVVDNGKGMSDTDARLAFERHATSKIRQAADLFSLHTMGFRGEALASIAAVAQVELRTSQSDSGLGTLICVAASNVESQEAVACAKGSNFSVKNLFYNIPARRKFLKSNQTELSNVLTEFERIALVNPEVSFTLSHNGTEMLNLPALPLRQRIMGVFGKKLNQDLLSLEINTTMVKIYGFIGKPETARKKGARQYFFANGRYMRHPYFHKAVADAYENLVPVGEQVSYFLYFEVDPANIDVNIHPTKTEIKFENEQAIWQILSASIKETLGRFNAVPSIDFNTEDKPEIPVFSEMPIAGSHVPETVIDSSYNPFNTSPRYDYRPETTRKSSAEWQPFFQGLEKPFVPDVADAFQDDTDAIQHEDLPHSAPVLYEDQEQASGRSLQYYQYKGCYVLTSVKSGLMIINQQRAHIRILYERYMEQISSHKNASQRVLFPEIVQLSPSEIPVLDDIMDDLNALGFDLSSLGNGSYAINGVPSGIEGLNPEALVTDLVHAAKEKGTKVKEEVQSVLALSLSKAAAIVPGQVLSTDEMNHLVDDLLSLSTPNYTPDGKTVLTVLKEDEIEKMFK